MSDGYAAYGTKLKIDGTEVGNVTDIDGLSISADTVDVSHHGMDDRYRRFKKSLINGGEVTFEGNLTNLSDAETIKDAVDSEDEKAIEIEFPEDIGVVWSFDGLLVGFETSAPLEDKASYSATIQVTGKPNLEAPGAG